MYQQLFVVARWAYLRMP